MISLSQLKRRNPLVKSSQVGRGGKRGKTSGRGGKGQTARAGHKVRPEIRDFIKSLPKLRGRGKNSNKSFQERAKAVNLADIAAVFENGEVVSPESLRVKGLVRSHSGRLPRVKILGGIKISKKFTFSGCEFSESARKALGMIESKAE